MEDLQLNSSTVTVLSFFIVNGTALCIALLLAKAKNTAKPCKPVTETGRNKGKMVIGTYPDSCIEINRE